MSQPAAKLQEPLPSPRPPLHPAFAARIGVGAPPDKAQPLTKVTKARLRELRGIQVRIRRDALQEGRTPQELASLTRAWDTLEARRAILMGHGTPAQVPARNAPTTNTLTDNWTDEGPAPVVIPGGKA